MLRKYEFVWKLVYIGVVILIASCDYTQSDRLVDSNQHEVSIKHSQALTSTHI